MATVKPTLMTDEITLTLIATGIIQLSEKIARGEGIRYPYPIALQRGLNRLASARLQRGLKPPQSVMDLINWCKYPLNEWQLDLPLEAIGDDDHLLRGVT